MSSFRINDAPILSARIVMPRTGAWVATVHAFGTSLPANPITIATADGKFSIKGTLDRADVAYDTISARVVAGGGGLQKRLPSKTYRIVPVRIPLADILKEAGETLSSTVSSSLLSKILPHWTRAEDEAGQAIAALAEQLGVSWRVLSDGSIWIGEDTWPASTSTDYVVLDKSPETGRVCLGIEQPSFLPGTTFEGKRISLVEHSIEASRSRTELWTEEEGEASRLLAGFRRIIRRALPFVDYHAVRRAKVIAQAADGSLDIAPTDPRFKGMQRVPIRYGVPGVTAKVPAGTYCQFTFDGGNPSVPIVVGFEPGAVIEITLGGDSGRAVARQGDLCSMVMPPVIPVTGTVSGQPFVGTMTIATPVTGSILTGSGKVKVAT